METNTINNLSLQTRGTIANLSGGTSSLTSSSTKTGSTKPKPTKSPAENSSAKNSSVKNSSVKKSSAKKSTSSSSTKQPATSDASKITTLAQKVKDTAASSGSILDKFKGQIPAEDYTRLQLQQALEQRSQLISLVTNLMQTMHEMAMSVIRNFRVG